MLGMSFFLYKMYFIFVSTKAFYSNDYDSLPRVYLYVHRYSILWVWRLSHDLTIVDAKKLHLKKRRHFSNNCRSKCDSCIFRGFSIVMWYHTGCALMYGGPLLFYIQMIIYLGWSIIHILKFKTRYRSFFKT